MQSLANELNVPVEALRCAIPNGKECKKCGCNNPALERNYNSCAVCRRLWYPGAQTESAAAGASAPDTAPGDLLLGPEFMRVDTGTPKNKMLCGCPSLKCRRMGFIEVVGYVALPVDPTIRTSWLLAMGWHHDRPEPGKRILLAAWHWRPEHRQRLDSGKWALRILSAPFIDDEGKNWGLMPPPLNAPGAFIDEFKSSREHPTKRWATQLEPGPLWYKPDNASARAALLAQSYASSSSSALLSAPSERKRSLEQYQRAESTEDALSRKTEKRNDLLRRLECQARIAAREKELKEVALVDNLYCGRRILS